MALVFFDLDGTLLEGESSERQFVKYLFKERLIKLPQLLAVVKFILRSLDLRSLDPRSSDLKSDLFKKNKAYLYGLSVKHIHLLAERFVENYLIKRLRKSLIEKLQVHQREKDIVVLLTGTPYFIAEPLAKRLNFNYFFGTLIQESEGYFGSEKPLQHPFGQEKLAIASRLCQELNAQLCQSTAYADSVYDLPLLCEVGKAVLVEPDSRCETYGMSRGWEVIKK